jgi:hypothetical protein
LELHRSKVLALELVLGSKVLVQELRSMVLVRSSWTSCSGASRASP